MAQDCAISQGARWKKHLKDLFNFSTSTSFLALCTFLIFPAVKEAFDSLKREIARMLYRELDQDEIHDYGYRQMEGKFF